MGFLSPEALERLGLAGYGSDVFISDKASLHNPRRIRLGNRVRIDDFCILSAGEGGITLGNNIHIGAYSAIIGAAQVTLDDFANISARVSIYSSSDDYSGRTMTNPMVPDEYKNVDHRPVHIGRHAILGCGTVVLPGVVIGDGAAVGALSLVVKSCEPFGVYAGTPAQRLKVRQADHLELEQTYLRTLEQKE